MISDLFIDRSESRRRIVKELGFGSYQKYLEGWLWFKIRGTVYRAKGGQCVVCGGPANEVHHDRYTRANLSGRSLVGLHPMCHFCHDAIHHDDDRRKLTLHETNARLKARMRR